MIERYLELLKKIGINSNIPEDIAYDSAQTIAVITLFIVAAGMFFLGKF